MMNSNLQNEKESSIFPDELTELIVKLSEVLPQELGESLNSAITTSEQNQNAVPLKMEVRRQLDTIESIQTALNNLFTQTELWEADVARREQYGEKWWRQKRQVLTDAFQNDPKGGAAEWLRVFVETLIAWELEICNRLINEPFPLSAAMNEWRALFQQGLQGIHDEDYKQAVEMLKTLTQGRLLDFPQPILEASSRAVLFIFLARIYLFRLFDNATALAYFEQAKQLIPEDGLVYAALGDYYRVQDHRNQAKELYQQAIKLSPDKPEGYIGIGLLAESDKDWDEADDWYGRAIGKAQNQKDIGITLSKLLAPTTGNLYLELARVLNKQEKQEPESALRAVEQAFKCGIKGNEPYPERIGYRLKGEILEKLQQPVEAALAYYEAGCRFGWRRENQIAIELLSKARELNPEHISTYWSLSDNLLTASWQPLPPYVNKEQIQQALEVWEDGAKIKLPDSSESWVYTLRALIVEVQANLPGSQRTDLLWEAVAYAERAIFLDAKEHYQWVHLARFHRNLKMELTALQDTEKALEIDNKDTFVLEERAAILATIGQFSEAESFILERDKIEKSSWVDAVHAFILLGMNKTEEALKLADGAVKESQENLWFREVRADCYRKLGQIDKAQEDNQWIWDRHDKPEYEWIGNQKYFGWAAYCLNKFDEAIDIFKKLIPDSIEAGFAHSTLGLCYFARGQIEIGQDHLLKGIELAMNFVEIDDILDKFETLSKTMSQPDQLKNAYQVIKEKIAIQKENLNQPHTAETAEMELEHRVREFEEKGDSDGWGWIGAQAGLARMYHENGKSDEAAKIYRFLVTKGERFFEAQIDLERIRPNEIKLGTT